VTDDAFHTLPTDLRAPVDDGAAAGIPGREMPCLALPASTGGEVDLRAASTGLVVLYVYPRTGVPGEPSPEGWDAIPGARGCTPQSCAFRDARSEFARHGADILGLSAQEIEAQRDFAAREHITYPLLADPRLTLADALGLPTFTVGGLRLYRRITLIARAGRVEKAFYPVFPPDRNPQEVLSWLAGH